MAVVDIANENAFRAIGDCIVHASIADESRCVGSAPLEAACEGQSTHWHEQRHQHTNTKIFVFYFPEFNRFYDVLNFEFYSSIGFL